jgi:hypothetical protein
MVYIVVIRESVRGSLSPCVINEKCISDIATSFTMRGLQCIKIQIIFQQMENLKKILRLENTRKRRQILQFFMETIMLPPVK